MTRKIIVSVVFVIVCALMFWGIYKTSVVDLKSGGDCVCYRYDMADSLMLEERHMGYVNLHKFLNLAATHNSFDSISDFKWENDSTVRFDVKNRVDSRVLFYGSDCGVDWKSRFKNIPVSITDSCFSAKVKVIDSIEYVYIPYQILTSVALSVERLKEGDGNDNITTRNQVYNSQITITNRENLPEENSSAGKKIQTGGFVFKNVSDILAKYGQNCYGNNYEQMKVLWKYVKEHWNYITDPYDINDTWRSAYETVENYYFVAGACYSGDCDDFAILMASFARQIGFRSHLVTAFNDKGGHAYAEFFDKSTNRWIPLDWFGDFGRDQFNGKIYRIYEDL